jgi:cytidine deaminase
MVMGMDAAGTKELITAAAAVLRPHKVGDRVVGDVAATLVTEEGRRFSGVCIDTVLPLCGRCREFIRQIDPANLDATVVLGTGRTTLLRNLLPAHQWPQPGPED